MRLSRVEPINTRNFDACERQANPRAARVQEFATRSVDDSVRAVGLIKVAKGSCNDFRFSDYRDCRDLIFPGFAGTPARIHGGFCEFWALFLRIQARIPPPARSGLFATVNARRVRVVDFIIGVANAGRGSRIRQVQMIRAHLSGPFHERVELVRAHAGVRAVEPSRRRGCPLARIPGRRRRAAPAWLGAGGARARLGGQAIEGCVWTP